MILHWSFYASATTIIWKIRALLKRGIKKNINGSKSRTLSYPSNSSFSRLTLHKVQSEEGHSSSIFLGGQVETVESANACSNLWPISTRLYKDQITLCICIMTSVITSPSLFCCTIVLICVHYFYNLYLFVQITTILARHLNCLLIIRESCTYPNFDIATIF